MRGGKERWQTDVGRKDVGWRKNDGTGQWFEDGSLEGDKGRGRAKREGGEESRGGEGCRGFKPRRN